MTVLCLMAGTALAQPASKWSFTQQPGRVEVSLDGKPVAVYVYVDETLPRPYFKDLRTADGIPVSRNYPPIEGQDPTDHPTYHPGIWTAFGDINGADFWRNKASVRHEGFAEEPKAAADEAGFAVRNAYESDGKLVCRETCRYTFRTGPDGYCLIQDSRFEAPEPFTFGDQEEMGFGVRVATPISVKHGHGVIVNSDGLKNEEAVWGKTADWCDYSGVVDGRLIGVALMPHPGNFRPSWFHARDYGLLVANPFGRNAFTEGEKSAVPVAPGETFRLRFAAYIHSTPETRPADIPAAYRRYVESTE